MLRIIFTVCFLAWNGLAQGQEILNPDWVVRQVLEKNFSIKIAETNAAIAKNNNTLGNAGMLPVVSGQMSKNFNVTNTNIVLFDPNLAPIERTGVQNSNANAGLNLTWTVFDGFGMFINRERFRELERQGGVQIEQAVENAMAQTYIAYYEVSRQQRRVTNFKKGLEISNDRLRLARDRYEVGQGSKVDFQSAQVDYNEDRAALIVADQGLELAKINLNALLQRNPSETFSVQDSIPVNPKLNLEALREAMRKQNPALVLADFDKKLADLDVKSQRANLFPQVDLLTGYSYNTLTNGVGPPQGTRTLDNFVFSYGLRASINIFDGYNQKRREQNAKLGSLIAEYQVNDLRNTLHAVLERTFLSYRNSLDLIKLESENYDIARQNVDIAFERFKVGNSTSYELREVQRNAVAAQTRLIEAQFNAKMAEIELIRLAGEWIK
jgi:outer membrane protein